jgi:hypothetical protein
MKYALLSPQANTDIILGDIQRALEKQGHEVIQLSVVSVDVLGINEMIIPPLEMSLILDIHCPDRIIWHGLVGFPYMELWRTDRWKSVPKFSLNYDEPFARVCGTGEYEEAWIEAGKSDDFFILIWDGYWRKKAEEKWGIKTYPCHLAANEFDYEPIPSLATKEIVFFGMFQSINSIISRYKSLPEHLKPIIKSLDRILTSGVVWAAEGNHCHEPHCGEESIELLAETDISKESMADQRSLRWCAWALTKNSTRARVLRGLFKKGKKVSMYCDHKQLGHATESEIRQMLHGSTDLLKITDTSDWSIADLRKIPNIGQLHLQVTDPQSVRGGIPYRVFQLAACAMPLLTNETEELKQEFDRNTEYIPYHNHMDVYECAELALCFNLDTESRGQMARERFLKHHTWTHRIAEWEMFIDVRNTERALRASLHL